MRFYSGYVFFVGISFLSVLQMQGQQSILLNQSSYNLFVLNPAAIGLNEDVTANCHYKKNWLGLADSPELLQLTLDGALSKNKYGLGLNVINEKAGIFSKTYLSGAFRYKIKLSKGHDLLFGLSAGFQRQLSDFSKIKPDAPEEFAQWPQQQAVTIPDAAFGLVYIHKKLIITASATQLLQQNYAYREPVYNKQFQYKTVSQFIISLQNTFVLKPDVWFYSPQLTVRTPQGLPFQIDLVNTINYKNKLLMGIGYRYYYALYANLGYCITDKLRIIYSYEYSHIIQTYTRGGHEIGLRFGLSNRNAKPKMADEHLNSRSIDEIFEKLDKHDQQVEVLTKKVDSLDKNLANLKLEIETLKSKQVSTEELQSAVGEYVKKNEIQNLSNENGNKKDTIVIKNKENKVDRIGKYKVISPKTDKDFESNESEESSANYKIVLGVYQLENYAREYQKFLKREFNWDSKLVQLNDHPKKFIYVCIVKEHASLQEALNELKATRQNVKSKSVEVTRGDAWILQTISK